MNNEIYQWLLDQMSNESLNCYTCNQPCLTCSSYNITPRSCNGRQHCHRRKKGDNRWCPVAGKHITALEDQRLCTTEIMFTIILENL